MPIDVIATVVPLIIPLLQQLLEKAPEILRAFRTKKRSAPHHSFVHVENLNVYVTAPQDSNYISSGNLQESLREWDLNLEDESDRKLLQGLLMQELDQLLPPVEGHDDPRLADKITDLIELIDAVQSLREEIVLRTSVKEERSVDAVGAEKDVETVYVAASNVTSIRAELALTDEGYYADRLEVVNEKDSVVLRYKNKRHGKDTGSKTRYGAIRGKSSLNIVSTSHANSNWGGEKNHRQIYEIQVEVLGRGEVTTTKKAQNLVAKGFGIGVVNQRSFKKNVMPGCYTSPDAGVGYDSRVERGQVRRACCPLGSTSGRPMELGWAKVGDKVGMIVDIDNGVLRYTRNQKQVVEVDLKAEHFINLKKGLWAVIAMASDSNCQLRILKLGWAARKQS